MDEKLNEMLNFDPLGHAEKLTDKSYKEDKDTQDLGFVTSIMHNRNKSKALESIGDTTFSMNTEPYIAVIEALGFVKVFENKFISKTCGEHEEMHYVYWHPKGCILNMDTFRGRRNTANIYFQWTAKDKSRNCWDAQAIQGCSGGFDADRVFKGSLNAREAFKSKFTDLMEEGDFITPWVKGQFLWLLSHGDTDACKAENYQEESANFDRMNLQRLMQLPNEIQKALSVQFDK